VIECCNTICHVLHVEDHAGDARMVERVVDRMNGDVRLIRVEDGESALQYLRSARHDERVDLVLLDLMLPRMQGTEVLAEIRSDRSIHDTPVVALTSSEDDAQAQTCRQRGVNGYLQKDDNPAALSGKLARILGLWCQEAANTPDDLQQREPDPAPSVEPATPRRRRSDPDQEKAGYRLLIVDDSAPDASMMARFLDGIDDLDIQTATESREADSLLRNEHFDVILLDYRMPGLSGLDYLEVIRRRDPDVGVIMVTAFSDEKVAIKSIRRRVDDYLRKEDLTREALVDAVEQLLIRVRRRRSATVDPVTGLSCVRAVKDRIEEACERFRLEAEEFCLLGLDLARFSDVNVQHGRATGDRVLRRVANVLPDALRPGDFVGRYRDDEFVVVAPATDARTAESLAERLRDCIRRLRFDYGDGEFTIDCVVGVTSFSSGIPSSAETALEYVYRAAEPARSSRPIRVTHFDPSNDESQ